MKRFLSIVLTILILAACAPKVSAPATIAKPEVGTVVPDNSQTRSVQPVAQPSSIAPTVIPALTGGLSPTELKYRLLEQFPNFFFCDPDAFPVARVDSGIAQQRFPEIQANTEMFQAILKHLNLVGQTDFSADQIQQIYDEYKKLSAILFEVDGDQYRFQIQTSDTGSGRGTIVAGTIDGAGAIQVLEQKPGVVSCPICLAAYTLIDTPQGPRPVESLRAGEPVWTVDANGQRVAALILRVGSARVPEGHQMVHVQLDDGRELWASPGHPTADGRTFADLRAGDLLDSGRIILVERVPYDQPATFDLLPAGASGFYWANGILVGSTLFSR